MIRCLAFLIAMFPATALACIPAVSEKRNTVLKNLLKTYGETPKIIGVIDNNGGVAEIVASMDGNRSWTLIVTGADGCSVPVMTGENWELIPAAQKGDPS